MLLLAPPPFPTAAAGFCSHCARTHRLPRTPLAEAHALELLSAVDEAGTFDLSTDPSAADARYRTDACGNGKMLGVLTCTDGTVLRAFSGMLGGTWRCPGWAGPVATLTLEDASASARFQQIVESVQRASAAADPAERSRCQRVHRSLSAALSADLAQSVALQNWRGAEVRLPELLERQRQHARVDAEARDQEQPVGQVLRARRSKQQQRRRRLGGGGGGGATLRPPGGVGDCAAPKLLHAAHALGLRPDGLAEVWFEPPARRRAAAMLRPAAAAEPTGEHGHAWPQSRRRGGAAERREHGSFHPACAERCAPILGFMLCGLEEPDDRTVQAV